MFVGGYAMRHPYSYALLLLFSLVLAACGGQTAGGTNVGGTWSGQISGPGGSAPLTLQLTQTGTNVNGTLGLNQGQLSVTGTVAGNLVSLSGGDADGTLQLEGSVAGTAMQGTINATSGGETVSVAFSVTKG